MWRRLFPKSIASYIYALISGAAITIYVIAQTGFDVLISYVNGLTSSGILLVLFGLLMLAIHLGAGDSLTYTFRKIRETHRKDSMIEELTRQSYWDYIQTKQNQRKVREWTFMAYIWVGVVFIAAGFLVELGIS